MTHDLHESLIGSDPSIEAVRCAITQLATTDICVLITGETGTGKELVAQLIHSTSSRSRRPMVCINCAALPESLCESELFGYGRGAFTGAAALTPGKLDAAHCGTIFLDEIGDMNLHIQAKLLRALDCKEFYRLGSREVVRIDMRVVAATNRNLEKDVEIGQFRSDLYYRINVARIHLTPLRERRTDIPIVAEHLLRGLSSRMGCPVRGLSAAVFEALINYTWPGNVRELRNVLEIALLHRPTSLIELAHLPDRFMRQSQSLQPITDPECQRILTVLDRARWNKTRASEILAWSRSKLYRKLREYRIE